MKARAFWEAKLRMALHDPPHKPFVLRPGTGGHRAAARRLIELIERIIDEPIGRKGYYRPADFAASGADRPVLNQRRGASGRVLNGNFTKAPLVTHPLMGGVAMALSLPEAAGAKPHTVAEQHVEAALKALEALDSQQEDAWAEAADAVPPADPLADAATLEQAFWWTWRAWRDDLSMPNGTQTGNPLWDLLPADSRCPDHSIWEHLRVASALAFLGVRDPARHPWLLTVSVAPVQTFIRESRTFRDLWMSSFLVSELAFAAMTPFLERYGPDCILYPDLRGNARMDVWMHRHRRGALPAATTDPCTQAALIPNSFVVLAPQGPEGDAAGNSHLRHLRAMAEDSRESMADRWRALCGLVERWLEKTTRRPEAGPQDATPWKMLWERQLEQGPQLVWSAMKWNRPRDRNEMVNAAESLRRRESLPAQGPHPSSEGVDADQANIARRRARLSPWLPARVAGHYEQAREVFGAVNLNYLQTERGFDYPIVHHVLRTRHRLRAQSRNWVGDTERGEKCTTCGKRQALSDDPDEQDIDRARTEARKFWSHRGLDPEERGADRLCAVCSVKRFLVVASSDTGDEGEAGLGPVLLGRGWKEAMDGDRLRVPFPSTSVVALQDYLAWAVEREKGVDLCVALEATDLDRTNFPCALTRLALASREPGASRDLLQYDAQYAMPHTLDAEIRRLAGAAASDVRELAKRKKLERVRREAGRLYKSFCKEKGHDAPDPRVAVVTLDADRLGRLILGDPDCIGATWADALHPDVATRLREAEPGSDLQWAVDAGWARLLGLKRHMGPSLHAFITRALAVFANTIVPWVVEREYGGRLVYAGGDDVLAVAPARDALRLAARLQQLFSAAWIVDTQPDKQPWSWREQGWPEKVSGSIEQVQSQARQRFVVPVKALGEQHIAWPVRWAERHCDPRVEPGRSGADEPCPMDDVQGRVHPMLGRHQSLSAGIAYAHYKNDLRSLIAHARHLLDDVAKRRCGRGAVAVGHFARNGEKSEFATPWSASCGPPVAQRRIIDVVDGFRRRLLPGRLPYKLRDLTDLALAESEPGRHQRGVQAQIPSRAFLRGLLTTALETDVAPHLRDAVIHIWKQGFRLHGSAAQGPREQEPERSVDGLLFCRALAGSGEER